MPRFFFNVRDGRNIPDENGEELPDWHAARQYAVRYAGRLLDHEAHELELGEDWCMEVCDERGLILFRLDFNVSLTAAVGGQDESPSLFNDGEFATGKTASHHARRLGASAQAVVDPAGRCKYDR